MQVSLLTDAQASRTLEDLIRKCVRFDVAVAWAGTNTVVAAMLTAHKKLGHVTIGTHMYQTDPAVLRQFMPYKGARCMPPNGRLFHPKVYLFTQTSGVSAVVGSHNLTGGAFGGNNIEVSVLLKGRADEPLFETLKSFIRASWTKADPLDKPDFLFAYEKQYLLNKAKRKDLEKFHRLKSPRAGAEKSPLDLTWSNFVVAVQAEGFERLEERLAILERAAELFSDADFSEMTTDERRAIAGTYGRTEPKLDGLRWLWFGTMSPQGDFKNLVSTSPKWLSVALSHIPLQGDVSSDEFEEFSVRFGRAFKGKAHGAGAATASRLLAMKRPDVFVAVNSANRKGISGAFGFAPTTLSLKNYWDRVIVPMQHSPFWLAPRPRGRQDGRIWDNRAALLDCIYYTP
jgi:HKD family nuclease